MSNVDQTECQTVVGEEIEETVAVEETGEAAEEVKETAAETLEEGTASPEAITEDDSEEAAPATANETPSDIFTHGAEQSEEKEGEVIKAEESEDPISPKAAEQSEEEAEVAEINVAEDSNAEEPITEDTLADTDAEPHMPKVLTEEPQVQACLPACLEAASESSPSTLKAIDMSELDVLVVPESANEVKESTVMDTAEPPKEEDTASQENTLVSDSGEKLATAESGPSKETTGEGTEVASSDGETNASEQAVQTEGKDASPTASEGSAASVRSFRVLAVPPQDLFFVVPPDSAPGKSLWVQGPHGPLMVQVPEGAKPGNRVQVRLCAPFQREVFVPVGAKAGDQVTFLGEKNEPLVAVVPRGKQPGDVFHVGPPATMLRVPEGAIPGDKLHFAVPVAPKVFSERVATVPPSMVPGQYFAALLQECP